MAGPVRAEPDDEPRQVVVTDPEPSAPRRASTSDLLEAIRNIPDQVAAKVGHSTDSEPSSAGGGRAEVTFEPEPPPVEPDDSDDADSDGAVDEGPAPSPVPQGPKFRHPSKARRQVEIGT
jgi:hypothetical protein